MTAGERLIQDELKRLMWGSPGPDRSVAPDKRELFSRQCLSCIHRPAFAWLWRVREDQALVIGNIHLFPESRIVRKEYRFANLFGLTIAKYEPYRPAPVKHVRIG